LQGTWGRTIRMADGRVAETSQPPYQSHQGAAAAELSGVGG